MEQHELNKIAIEYINSNISLRELASLNKLSKATLVRYFKGEKDVFLNSELQEKVDNKKKENWIEGKSTSGNLGNTKYTKEKIIFYARHMLSNSMTLRDLEEETNIAISTLYELFTEENLGDVLYNDIVNLYGENKSNAFRK